MKLHIPVPAIRGHIDDTFAVYQTVIAPDEITQLLGHDPRKWHTLPAELRSAYEVIQRKTNKARRRSVGRYIRDRMGPNAYAVGAFPAISVGISRAGAFQPVPVSGVDDSDVGILKLDLSPGNLRILLDGMARTCGALDLIDQGDPIGDWFTLPVTIFAPREGATLSVDAFAQVFCDFNVLATAVSPAHAIALDRSDPWTQAANRLGERDPIARLGGVAERVFNVPRKSNALVAQRVLRQFVRAGAEGARYLNDKQYPAEPNLTGDTMDDVVRRLALFLDEVAEGMGRNRFADKDSVHLAVPGWRAMGILAHDLLYRLKLPPDRASSYARRIGSAVDWSRYNPAWLAVGKPDVPKGRTEPVTDDQGRVRVRLGGALHAARAIADIVRETIGLDAEIAAHEAGRAPVVTAGDAEGVTDDSLPPEPGVTAA